jgi:hypothetical protein
MKTYINFIAEKKSNIKNIDYLAIQKNTKGEPVLYVVDFNIIKDDGEKVECKVKGYEYSNINDSKNGFIEINDYSNDKIHTLHKSDFKSGTVRKKIYEI